MLRKTNFLIIMSIIIAIAVLCRQVQAESEIRLSKGQTIYVPIYSHIYTGDRETPFYLAATLSVRNIDLKYPITLLSADYYDSDGKLIKKYIEEPVQINPLSSTQYVIKESDKTGGSGANFIVRWKSANEVNPPIIESVMIGTRMQQGISFTSRGQVIREE